MESIVKVLCYWLYIVNGGCMELILVGLLVNVLWQCLYVVNAGCIGVDTCRIACERAVAVLVRSECRLHRS